MMMIPRRNFTPKKVPVVCSVFVRVQQLWGWGLLWCEHFWLDGHLQHFVLPFSFLNLQLLFFSYRKKAFIRAVVNLCCILLRKTQNMQTQTTTSLLVPGTKRSWCFLWKCSDRLIRASNRFILCLCSPAATAPWTSMTTACCFLAASTASEAWSLCAVPPRPSVTPTAPSRTLMIPMSGGVERRLTTLTTGTHTHTHTHTHTQTQINEGTAAA